MDAKDWIEIVSAGTMIVGLGNPLPRRPRRGTPCTRRPGMSRPLLKFDGGSGEILRDVRL